VTLRPPFDRNARIAVCTAFTWLAFFGLIHWMKSADSGIVYIFFLWGLIPVGGVGLVVVVWGLMHAIDLLFEGGVARRYGLAAVALHVLSMTGLFAYWKFA
jgi:hypothetical protein